MRDENTGCIAICAAVVAFVALWFWFAEFGDGALQWLGDLVRPAGDNYLARYFSDPTEPWWEKVGGVLVLVLTLVAVTTLGRVFDKSDRR